ncbi:unnamed protein product [Lampetra planeri]
MQRCLKNIPSALQAYETSLQLIMSTTTSVGPEVNSILNDINDLKQLIDPQHNAQAAAVQDRELGCFLSGDLQLHGYRFHAATHADEDGGKEEAGGSRPVHPDPPVGGAAGGSTRVRPWDPADGGTEFC